MQNKASVRHLDTVQPEWEHLPLACELVKLRRREPENALQNLAPAKDYNHPHQIKGVIRLLRKLELIDGGELTERGKWLSETYISPDQRSQLGRELGVGVKKSLSATEQLLLWMVIFHKHRFPMLAVLHQVAVEPVPEKQALVPAERLAERIDYLYPEVESVHSWKPRAKVHYKWLMHLGLAKVRARKYTLTPTGQGVFKQVEPYCPDEWEEIKIEPDTTLSDFTP